MPKFSSKRLIHHSAPEMFDLVADVERYPEFVPLCQSLKIRQRTAKPDGTEIVVADMTVSFKLVREAFTSRVTLDRPNLKILVEYLQPTRKHHEVKSFITPEEFASYATIGVAKGFLLVSSSPLTRSSHHAGDDFARLKAARAALSR